MQQKIQGLKKEFSKKDVNRARNLIMGKTGASTGTQIGYKKQIKDYKEGDVWTEGRKTWTIKNGIKQTVSKLDKVKKEIHVPLCCPKCSKVMKHHLDKNNYRINKKCHDCVVKFEHKLKYTDKYDEYINKLKVKNNLTILDEAESYLLDAINNTSNSQYVSEDGVIERWVGGIDKEKTTKELKQTIKETRKKIKSRLND
jgi:bacterioferritin-associated ferredoxin